MGGGKYKNLYPKTLAEEFIDFDSTLIFVVSSTLATLASILSSGLITIFYPVV